MASNLKISILHKYINSIENSNIVLLKNKEVLQWLFNDLTFLEKVDKASEDKWGQQTMKIKRPDLKLDKQWTNRFGEYICQELFTLLDYNVSKPEKIDHMQPDLQTNEFIIEVKTQTYLTSGTAGEKILGTPFKYASVPRLFNKPLKIVCLGNAEKLSRNNYGNLEGEKMTLEKKRIIDFYKDELKIEYIGITQLLKDLINKTKKDIN